MSNDQWALKLDPRKKKVQLQNAVWEYCIADGNVQHLVCIWRGQAKG